MADAAHRSGFVGIIGRPNVGKSTLLNYYLGEKLSIISPRPQTTRHRILGVLTRKDAQVMFLDTPGLHKPEHTLGRYLLEVTKAVIDEADVLVVMIDARAGLTAEDERVFGQVRDVLRRTRSGTGGPSAGEGPRAALLAINKVDLVKKPKLLPLLERCAKTKLFTACIPVSAQTGVQMDVLLSEIIGQLPEGPEWYEPQQRTDQPEEQRIRETIREQLLLATRQEVPHAIEVFIERLEERPGLTAIYATVLVERPGQKAIVIGRGGEALKRVGQEARRQIERLIGRKVHLELWVKVAEDWRHDERLLRQLGYQR
ncbi:MAG: GTPase Era [Candidatus Omnitrophica bacterium CG11_big_fil_rev_8_21_14_0_20_63_9]|nr:MAG: GTPase Era [Candidatus Omnitrophica bacterium CG11_big_fil_rev_8_21_14_0_20_63_9]